MSFCQVVEKAVDLQLMKSQFENCVRECMGSLKAGLKVILNHVRCTGVDDYIVKTRVEPHRSRSRLFTSVWRLCMW